MGDDTRRDGDLELEFVFIPEGAAEDAASTARFADPLMLPATLVPEGAAEA